MSQIGTSAPSGPHNTVLLPTLRDTLAFTGLEVTAHLPAQVRLQSLCTGASKQPGVCATERQRAPGGLPGISQGWRRQEECSGEVGQGFE